MGGAQHQVEQLLAVEQAADRPGRALVDVQAKELLGACVGQHQLVEVVDDQDRLGEHGQDLPDLLALGDGTAAADLQGRPRLLQVFDLSPLHAEAVADFGHEGPPRVSGRQRRERAAVLVPAQIVRIEPREVRQIPLGRVPLVVLAAEPKLHQAHDQHDPAPRMPSRIAHGLSATGRLVAQPTLQAARTMTAAVNQLSHFTRFISCNPQSLGRIATAHRGLSPLARVRTDCTRQRPRAGPHAFLTRDGVAGIQRRACRQWASAASNCPSFANVQPIKK